MSEQEAFDELAFYTLTHPDPMFIHQYAVDAFAAQYADQDTKRIKVAFALAGLYLHHEKGYTGRQAQLAHVQLTSGKDRLPVFDLPSNRGHVTVWDVLKEEPGASRDAAIARWSESVWHAYIGSRSIVAEWLKRELDA